MIPPAPPRLRFARGRSFTLAAGAVLLLGAAAARAGSLTGPILDEGLTVVLEDVRQLPATSGSVPLARINVMLELGDGSHRIFVNDLRGPLYVIRNGALSVYLDFRTAIPNFKTTPGLGTGLVSFAFHPEFATNGLFYTVHSETPGAIPPNLVPPLPISTYQHSVLSEWHATNPAADVFAGTRRELMRIATASVAHNLGVIDFDPNAAPGDPDYGLLYLGSGDFGSVDLHQPLQLQRLDTVYGCVLRIDPAGGPFTRGGITYPYGIPPDNPFAADGDPNTFGEIWTYGHRNAHRLVWDPAGNQSLFACDVGEFNVEEVDELSPGANYGWPRREGTFALDPANPSVVFPLPGNDATFGYSYPVAEFDHEEADAIAGGVAYRGPVPRLWGKFVFGDIVTGRMFYSYLADLEAANDGVPATVAPVYELHLYHGGQERRLDQIVSAALGMTLERTDLRLATDLDGAMYVMTKEDGFIRKVTATVPALGAPDPATDAALEIRPNPVRTSALVTFATPARGTLRADVYDIAGRRVRELIRRSDEPAGPHEARLAVADGGARLSPGVYVLRIEAAGRGFARRFVVVGD